jgi:carbon-monoxide dehydrogenase medium subunit
MRGFDFLAPKSLNEALRSIDGKGRNYKLLAGGTNLIPDIREGAIAPRLVVDLGGIRTLKDIKEVKGTIRIGPLVTVADLLNAQVIKEHAPVLWEAARRIAGPLVRNRATVGGNIVDASPAADTAVPLLALKARVRLQSLQGQRTLPLDEFFTGYRKTAVEPGEILTEVSFPIPPGDTKQGYCKLGRRNAMAISVASVAVVLNMNGKTCADAGIALGAVAPTPLRAEKAEALLRAKRINLKLATKCGEAAAKSARPIDDLRAPAGYRSLICEVLVRRLICQCLGLEDGVEPEPWR